jgi:hypothetical protein
MTSRPEKQLPQARVWQLNLHPVPKVSSDWLVLPLGRNNDFETLGLIRGGGMMWHVLIGCTDVGLDF